MNDGNLRKPYKDSYEMEISDTLLLAKRLLDGIGGIAPTWQVGLYRDEDGVTHLDFRDHTHPMIAFAKEMYPEDETPLTDDDGYIIDEDLAECDDSRIHRAWFLAYAPLLVERLVREVENANRRMENVEVLGSLS